MTLSAQEQRELAQKIAEAVDIVGGENLRGVQSIILSSVPSGLKKLNLMRKQLELS